MIKQFLVKINECQKSQNPLQSGDWLSLYMMPLKYAKYKNYRNYMLELYNTREKQLIR